MFAGFGASRFGGRLCTTFEVIGLPIQFGDEGPEPAQTESAPTSRHRATSRAQNVTGSDSRP